MNYTPTQDKKTAYFASIALMIPGVLALFLAPSLGSQAILQFFGIGCCSAGLFLLYRYALITFHYTVEDGELTVTRVTGKRLNAVARIPLSACDMLVRESDEGLNQMKFPAGRYSYRVSITAKERFVLSFKDAEQRAKLTLECDKAFAEFLSTYLPPDARISL